jgi:serine/threonine-protein kinase
MDDGGRLLGGRYRLGPVVGEGGMAVVHEADDERLGRRVAVKVLRPGFTAEPGFLARFEHEARAAASLSHPNIVAIHDSGSDRDLHYIVMDLVDGPSLADALAAGRIPADRAIDIAAQVADGLAAAHRRGIVHRDVKPANILIDRSGRALVGDFGIARAFAATALTTTGMILGSLPYLSPEQASGGDVTAASDIYSLGAVLFEMLTGRRPFDGGTAAAVVVRRLQTVPPPPSSLDPTLPAGLDEIVLRALAIDPGDRYPSAANFAQSLDAWRRRGLAPARASTDESHSFTSAEAAPPAAAEEASTDARTDAATVAGPDPERDTRPMPRIADAAIAEAPPANGSGAIGAPAPSSVGAVRRARRVRGSVGIPLALIAVAVAAVLLSASMGAFAAGRPGATATPTPGASGGGVLAATSTPSGSLEVLVAPPSTGASSASVGPVGTPAPTAAPTQARQSNVPPRPAPTRASTPPPVVAVGPRDQVIRFYDLVAAHRFAAAAGLWSARMRQAYPPATYIVGRFANTTSFELRRVAVASRSGTRASVAIDIVEHRTTSPGSERWVGTWSMVEVAGTWLLDAPNLAAG